MMQRQEYKHNGSRRRQMFSGRLMLTSFCCRRSGITKHAFASVKPSRRGTYHVPICSAFKEPFQSGLGKQQVAILSKYQAQAAWAQRWKSVSGVLSPQGEIDKDFRWYGKNY
jgi:hypothetical protein